jgi:hypothetical protein
VNGFISLSLAVINVPLLYGTGDVFFISGILLPRIFLGSLPIQLHDYKRTFPRPNGIHNGPLCALLGFTDISLMAPWPKGPTFTGLPLRE